MFDSDNAFTIARAVRVLTLGAAAVALGACGGGKDIGDGEDDAAAHIRAVNLIKDSPQVQVSIDGTAVFSAGYAGITSYNAAHVGSSSIQLAIPSPSDLTGATTTYTNIGAAIPRTFVQDKDYTLFVYGTTAAPQSFAIEGTDQRATVADNKVIWQIVDAAPALTSVDVYLTAPTAGISAPQFVANLTLGQTSTPAELTLTAPADQLSTSTTFSVDMTIELRQTGTGTVLFKSSKINVTEQSRVMFAITDNLGPGPSSVQLVGISGTAGGSGSIQSDIDDKGELSFANLSSDAGGLDATFGPPFGSVLATNVVQGQKSTYAAVDNGTTGVIANSTGTSDTVFVSNFTAAAGRSYTAYAIGPSTDIGGLVVSDDRRAISNQAQFRFLNAASSLADGGSLDIYVRVVGAGLDLTASSPPAATISGLGYRSVGGYIALKGGSYDVYFARAGTKTVLAGPMTITVTNGQMTTLALANAAVGGALTLYPFADERP